MKPIKSTLSSGLVAAVLVFAGIGGLALVARAQGGPTDTPAPAVQAQPPEQAETDAQDTIEDPSYTGSIMVDQAQTENMSEADEAAALQGQATISQADAEAAALAANPGTTVVKSELDNENGVLVYSVELSNGLDVKVDAGDAVVLHTEQAGDDGEEAGETADNDADDDQTQEEHESQADDANEAPGVEDAVGQ